MNEQKTNFEESLKRLETCAEKIQDQGLPLEEAIRCYEDGLREYRICKQILDEARQKIETIEEENHG